MPLQARDEQRQWTTERRWALVRRTLGMLQMFGATLAFVLLILLGATPLSLAVVVATGLLTTVSVLLFGERKPPWLRGTRTRK